MVYSTSKCPKCGEIIRQQTNPVKEIGNPFERCRHCGNIYLNSYKEEWITKSPIKRFFFFLQGYVWARAILIPFLLMAIPIAIFDMDVEVMKILSPIFSAIWLIVGYFVHKNASKEDIEASLRRTNDLKYVNLLKKAGYKIYPIENDLSLNITQHSYADNTYYNPEKKLDSNSDYGIRVQCSSEEVNLKQFSNESCAKVFSIEDMASGLAEICVNELTEITKICSKNNVSYDERKLVIATFAYFYNIWIVNFANITIGQAKTLEELYKKRFSLFNRKLYENESFKSVIGNEELLSEQLEKVGRKVRSAYNENSGTFYDVGISDEFILEFVDSQESKEIIKMEIVIKILKDWAHKATLMGKEIEIENN